MSNIDGVQLGDVLEKVDPARTLFVVCSKTFTTLETLTNAKLARQWIVDRLGEGAPARHFAAVSTNAKAMDAFLIPPQNRFTMWDWVGGRYSVWSAVGLVGRAGARHGSVRADARRRPRDGRALPRRAPFEKNLPVLMGLIGVWNRNFLGMDSLAVLPYDQRLHRFPAYLQQLEMESNGKRTTLDGAARRLRHRRGALGRARLERAALVLPAAAPGHGERRARLHRAGERLEPVPAAAEPGARELLRAGAGVRVRPDGSSRCAPTWRRKGLPESEIARLIPHKLHPGNRPSSIMLFPRLGPKTLGRLIALYEHKVFTQSVIWGINAFDQWGVELGKKLADSLAPALENPAARNVDASLRGLLDQVVKWRS